MSDGIWTQKKTATELSKLAKNAEAVAERSGPERGLRYALTAMRAVADAVMLPIWVQAVGKENRRWVEDDARPPDAESLNEAFCRLYQTRVASICDTFDGGDCLYALYAMHQSSRMDGATAPDVGSTIIDTIFVVTASCPGDSSIHEISDHTVVLWSQTRASLRTLFAGDEPDYSDQPDPEL